MEKIVFSRNIASKYTTLTYGYDVALRIADLVGKDCALGKAYHITTEECIKWEDVLECYLDVLEQHTGKRPEVCWTEKSDLHLETRFIATESLTAYFPMQKSKQTVASSRHLWKQSKVWKNV